MRAALLFASVAVVSGEAVQLTGKNFEKKVFASKKKSSFVVRTCRSRLSSIYLSRLSMRVDQCLY